MWESLEHLLGKSYGKHGLFKSVKAALTVEEAAKVVTSCFPRLGSRVKVLSETNGILVIGAQGPLESQEIMMQKRKLLEAFKGHGLAIREIKTRLLTGSSEPTPILDDRADGAIE